MKHCDYNKLVEAEIRIWKKMKNRQRVEKFVTGIQDGIGADGKINNSIKAFNDGIKSQIPPGVDISPYDGGSARQIKDRGLKSIGRRGWILASMGSIMSALSAHERSAQATEIITNGEGMKRAREAAEAEDCSGFKDALIGEDLGKQSVYSELRFVDPIFALAFRAAADIGFNTLDERQKQLNLDLENQDDEYQRQHDWWGLW